MQPALPHDLSSALSQGIQFFMGETHEWKLQLEKTSRRIEELAGSQVCIFANNGYGDYLFLKKSESGDQYDERVYEYFHEGPHIIPVEEELGCLLGTKPRKASVDCPQLTYDTGETIMLGDYVRLKRWFQFWKGWQVGTVIYLPGVSPRNPEYEHGGLKWIAVKYANGIAGCIMNPDTGIVSKVRFFKRKDI